MRRDLFKRAADLDAEIKEKYKDKSSGGGV
jgi:hypothetical protein